MNEVTQQITDMLKDRYGPFLTIPQLAEVLNRSPNGLRSTLQQDNRFSRQLKVAKTKVGRRVYFNVVTIAEIMTEETNEFDVH